MEGQFPIYAFVPNVMFCVTTVISDAPIPETSIRLSLPSPAFPMIVYLPPILNPSVLETGRTTFDPDEAAEVILVFGFSIILLS